MSIRRQRKSMQQKRRKTWMILKSVMLALSMNLMLCSCSSQSTPIPTPQHCPKMPQLPPQYHKVNVDAVEKTKEHFRNYLMTR
nr:MAG TPA: lipoprotein [Caudoviricetes sp.]